MNTTTLRAGFALVGTAAVLTTGALASGAIANATPAPAAAPAVTATTQAQTGKGTPDKAAKAREGVTFLTECVDENKVRTPKTFTLACGDANQRLENLTWTNWGGDNAFATGIVRENDSEPMSKGDKWISYPVKVKATGIVEGEASVSYTKLIVRTVGKAPQGVDALQIFDLPGVEPLTKVTSHANPSKPANQLIEHTKGWDDGHGDQSEDPIDHLNGWSDGHEDQSEDYIEYTPGWDDGHGDQSEDPGVQR